MKVKLDRVSVYIAIVLLLLVSLAACAPGMAWAG